MKIFSQFREKLIYRYIKLTGILIFIMMLLIFGFMASSVQHNIISKVNLLATEEAEELSYILNDKHPYLKSEPTSEESKKYLNNIFYYMYDAHGKLLHNSNHIDWSKESVHGIIAANNLASGETIIKSVFTSKHDFRFYAISQESIYNNNIYMGKVYVGIDISKDFMFLGRLFLWIIILLLISLLIVYKAGKYMANSAMQPIIESFEKQMLFAANASHELRTPLSVLLSGIDILQNDKENRLTDFSNEIVGDMRLEVLKMKTLVSNLLLLARCDNSAMTVNKEKIPLNPFLRDISNIFTSLSADNHITLSYENNVPDSFVYVDSNHFKQIMTILLDNAIKYTPKYGKISINISPQNDALAISVTNTGIGIPTKDLPHIFNRFYRSDNASKYEGTGLGLSIAKSLTEKNQGLLTVNSKENILTCFTLYLPSKD